MAEAIALPFRLDEWIALAIVLYALAGIATHFLREFIFTELGMKIRLTSERVERFRLRQRAFHWTNLSLVATLLTSGLAIYKPELFGSLDLTVRAWVAVHWYAAILLIVVGLFHILQDVLVLRRFGDMWVTLSDLRKTIDIMRRFFDLTEVYPPHGKYKVFQKVYHWAVVAVLSILGFTGFTMWAPFTDYLSSAGLEWLYIYESRFLHDLFTFVLIGLIIGHFYFAVIVPSNKGTLNGMIRGWVYRVETEREDREEVAVSREAG